jgi:hypothetical protein
MGHDFVYWGVIIGSVLAFTAVSAALGWLFYNAKVKKSGDR